MVKCKDLSWQGPNCNGSMNGSELQVFRSPLKVDSGRIAGEMVTGSRTTKAHWCVWEAKARSDPTEQLLQHKLLKKGCSDRKVSEHRALQLAEYGAAYPQTCQSVHVDPSSPLTHVRTDLDHRALEEGGTVCFLFSKCGCLSVCVLLIQERDGTRMHYGKEASHQRQWSEEHLHNVLLENFIIYFLTYFDKYHLPTHCCRPGTALHGKFSIMAAASFSRITCPDTLQKWFRNGLRKQFNVLAWPLNSTEHLSICGMCWANKFEPWRPHLTAHRI